jgi:5-methylcytosine-specific restriction endonuclease McrA
LINLNKKPRRQIGSQNGLRIYSKLKVTKSLKAQKPLGKISKKQTIKNRTWHEVELICLERAGYTCELKGKDCMGKYGLTGHHIIHRSQGGKNLVGNCIIGCPECHNHVKYADGMPITKDEAYKIIGVNLK